MGLKIWQRRGEGGLSFDTLRELFHLLTTTLLTLLLPLSFLLLARFSTAYYLLALNAYPTSSSMSPPSVIFTIFMYANPINPLHALVSALSVAALVRGLRSSSGQYDSNTVSRPEWGLLRPPRLYAAWIVLCVLQVCVGLGIEGSIGAGIDGSGFGEGRSVVCRLIFFLGLHETMLYWLRTVVKPVVDDTVFGFPREEKWMERAVISISFGSLWWWRLRDEVESLVVVAEFTREMDMAVGVAAFLGWWLYYLTVTIGMVKVVKGLIWFTMILLCKRVEPPNASELEAEEKV